jgi:uncharacterized membrane protein
VFQRQVRDYEPLLETFEDALEVTVEFTNSTDVLEEYPTTASELAAYDVLVISDLTRGTLKPHFHADAIPGPNLLKAVAEFVRDGGGLLYCGGWMIFQGYQGVGNWAGTPVEAILPVAVRPVYDDRVERPEGGEVTVTDTDHPLTGHLEADSFPVVYGYNETGDLSAGATSLAEVDGNHLLAAGEFGDGRMVAYASDPGPKWGFALEEWDGYEEFWTRALTWLAAE